MHVHDAQEMPSTDFIKWNKIIDDLMYHEPNLTHYMLARVCQEIRAIRLSFASGQQTLPDLDEFIVKFKQRGEEGQTPEEQSKKGIELGDPLDTKWQLVNDMAKARWEGFLGTIPE